LRYIRVRQWDEVRKRNPPNHVLTVWVSPIGTVSWQISMPTISCGFISGEVMKPIDYVINAKLWITGKIGRDIF
jgi:hypothetical protein